MASLRPVPAHPIPTAIAEPYLKWGLYDSARCFTLSGTVYGFLNNKKPRLVRAALLTSSFTSETA
jgi:hypothetical protein